MTLDEAWDRLWAAALSGTHHPTAFQQWWDTVMKGTK